MSAQLAALATSLALISAAHAQNPTPTDPPPAPSAAVSSATASGNYTAEDGAETEISSLFGDPVTWGQILAKLAGDNRITWSQTEPNPSGITGVQAAFTPDGAPPAISVTLFFHHGPTGVRFDRMKFAHGDDSREKSGLDALTAIAEGYRGTPATRASTTAILNKNHARQIILGCHIHASDHGDAFPPDLAALVTSGTLEKTLRWKHPESGDLSDFLYHGAGKNTSTPSDTVIVAAPAPIDGKRTIAQADGAVLDIPEADYQKAVAPK